MNMFKSRRFRQGSIATVITVLGVALIIIANTVLSTLADKLSWRLDLTPNKIFQISDDTKQFLAGIGADVNIYVLNTEEGFTSTYPQEYMLQANEIIKKYESLSPRVSVSYIDLVRNPSFASQYSDLSLRSNQILITEPASGRRTIVNYSDLFNIQTDQSGQSSVRSSKAEQVMTSAILNVTSDKKIRVTVLGGHNEYNASAFTGLLEKNNYEIVSQNLPTEEAVDPDAAIAILAAPQRDLSENELRKLDDFLYNNNQYGKTLFYMTSGDLPDPGSYPNLSAWLSEWGISVGDSVVFELSWNRRLSTTDPFIYYADYAEAEYSEQVKSKSLYPAVIYSKPISLLWTEKSSRNTAVLLQSSPQSGVLTEENSERVAYLSPSEADLTGPIPLLVISSETRYEQLTAHKSHVVASGSVYSFEQDALGVVNYSNSEYFLGILDTLAGREDTVKIQDKTISMEYMELTAGQIRVMSTVSFIVIPVALLVLGIVVWLRRRHS